MNAKPTDARTLPERSFLLLHGWQHHRPPEHWLYWLAESLREEGERASYPQLPDPDVPDLAAWHRELRRELADMGKGQRIVVAHSLGCLLWMHYAHQRTDEEPVERVLLVAPPSRDLLLRPELRSFRPVRFNANAVLAASRQPVRLACSDDDPYCPEGAASAYGGALGLDVDLLPGTGHLNPDTGYGPWPAVLDWAGDGRRRLVPRPAATPEAPGPPG